MFVSAWNEVNDAVNDEEYDVLFTFRLFQSIFSGIYSSSVGAM